MSETHESTEDRCLCSVYDIRFLLKRGITITPTLLKTLDAVITLKKATADDVAKYTTRARTAESRNLSRLNKLGIIAKIKEGRKTYYMEPVYAVQQFYSVFGEEIPLEQLAHMISMPADIVRVIVNCLKSRRK